MFHFVYYSTQVFFLILQHNIIQDELSNKGVSLELVRPITTVNEESLKDRKYLNSFNLTMRKMQDTLIEDYCLKVEKAHREYILAVSRADVELLSNVQECAKADKVLGAPEMKITNRLGTELKTLKDGTKFLQCPIINCSSGSFKLKRHLQSAHSDLTDYQTSYAIELSKKMYQNETAHSVPGLVLKNSVKRETDNFVYKKHNPKKCPICSKLIINLSDHLTSVHKIDKTTHGYKDNLLRATVVPKCYTKIVNGMTVELTGDELKKAEESYGEKVELQSVILILLKFSQDKMTALCQQLDETNDSDSRLKMVLLTS